MDGILRRLKLNELKATIALCESEQTVLVRELRAAATSNQRRAEIYQRGPRLKRELSEAVNDLKWLEAEERVRRSDRVARMGIVVQWERAQKQRSGVWTTLARDESQS